MKVEVAGYPGEKGGKFFASSGPIKSILEQEGGGCVISYDVDTTSGMSGSAISLMDQQVIENYPDLAATKKRHEDRGV